MDAFEQKLFKIIILAVLILTIIIVTSIGFMISFYRRKSFIHHERIQADTVLLEQERERIAADLHDDFGASLGAIKLKLQCLDFKNEQELHLIENVERTIDESMQKLRNISFNLMPQILKRKGLKAAVTELINKLDLITLEVNFVCEADINDHKKSIHIYRLIQEIVSNAIKHAEATEITIQIKHYRNRIVLNIADNGRGFNYNQAQRTNAGLGLQNIASRAELLKARMHLSTAIGKGVVYIFKIPF